MDLTTYAIPVFFTLMGIEALAARKIGRVRAYRGPDVMTDLSLGVMQVLFSIAAGTLLVHAYQWGAAHAVRAPIAPSVWSWALLFLGVDVCYYWFHRCAHRVAIGWASHAPHHSSEDYNLAVALRQGPCQPLFSRAFYLPLAWIGFPLEMFITISSLNAILQFFVHTELVGKLPWPIELVMNTPSHHRVHHGCNGRYLDKNHAGVFIVWDRLFGTFEPEGERPVYGTVSPVATWNPLRAGLKPFVDVFAKAAQARGWANKLRALFMPPGWDPGTGNEHEVTGVRTPYDAPAPVAAYRYAVPAFVGTLLLTVLFLVVGVHQLDATTQLLAIALLVLGYTAIGGLLDDRAWARPLEVFRLAGTAVFLGAIALA